MFGCHHCSHIDLRRSIEGCKGGKNKELGQNEMGSHLNMCYTHFHFHLRLVLFVGPLWHFLHLVSNSQTAIPNLAWFDELASFLGNLDLKEILLRVHLPFHHRGLELALYGSLGH